MIFLYNIMSELSKEIQYLIIVGIIGSAIYLSKLVKRRNSKTRRQSDRKKPSRRDKQVFETARKLASFGKYVSSAQLLESIGYVREAIGLLESKGYIEEASNILLKIQSPERAGAMYARHGMWDKATKCYNLANMPKEAAICSQEAGKVSQAANGFAEAGEYTKAANCFADIGQSRNAARFFVKAGKVSLALEQYQDACDQVDDLRELALEADEIRFIHEQLLEGKKELFLVDMLSAHGDLVALLVRMVEDGQVSQASEYYLRSTKDVCQELIDRTSDRHLSDLLIIFGKASAHVSVGKVYERLKDFAQAAANYEHGEDFIAAARCYELAGNIEKAREVKLKEKSFANDADVKTVIMRPDDSSSQTSAEKLPDHFSSSFVFEGIDFEECVGLWNLGQMVTVNESSNPLVSAGQNIEKIFIVIEGEIKTSDKCYSKGDLVANQWVLSDDPSYAEYLVVDNCSLWSIAKTDFLAFISSRPMMCRKVYQNIARNEAVSGAAKVADSSALAG